MSDDPDYFAEIARNMRKIAQQEKRNLQDHALDERIQAEKTEQLARDIDGLEKALESAPSPDKGVESSELVDPSKLPVQRHVGYIDPDTLQPAINPKLVNQGSTRRTSQHLLLPYF